MVSKAAARRVRRRAAAAGSVFALLCLLAGLVAAAAPPAGAEAAAASAALPERYQRWLESVDLMITDAEREVFLGLPENYQRDHFIRRFWKVRDPFKRTARNEFQELWEQRVLRAQEHFKDLSSPRAQMMLTFGEPSRRQRYTCTEVLKSLEVWEYHNGSERVRGYFTLVFIGLNVEAKGPRVQWQPSDGLSRLMATARATGDERQLAKAIARGCLRADEILSALAQALDVSRVSESSSLLPKPNDEWVRTFEARSTEVPEGAEPLSGELLVSFPGRHQSRTVVQGLVAVPTPEVEAAEIGDYQSYNLLVDGEVLRKGELFESFRYRFDFPRATVGERIPLVIQRYLRPGRYELIVKVEDLSSKRVFREARQLQVPNVKRRPVAVVAPGSGVGAPATPGVGTRGVGVPNVGSPGVGMSSGLLETSPVAGTTAARTPVAGAVAPAPAGTTSSFDTRLLEANSSISTGDHTVKILALPEILTVGHIRVGAQVRGDGISRVAFELNGRPVMRKSRPPYSVELDLGDRPSVHTLRVVALGDAGKELASDEVLINAGPHRFSVRLIEPQSGKRYSSSIRAHAEVEVPEGERLDRVELYLNETLAATLYQPPFEQPILLGGDGELTYVRAVAHLRDGAAAEDVKIINAPDYIDNVDVQFVELFTTVVDRAGEFVEGLSPEDFSVSEDGIGQDIRRFETMRDLPIRAGLVLDTSLSMMPALSDVKKAAHRFFESVLTERDRAALITFNDEPQLVVRFTNSQEVLAGGLTGLVTEGETALYDTVIFSLHYFSGLQGKRAIVILTDGEDSISTYTYADAIDFARRTGVAIYVVGLNLESKGNDVRIRMQRLASETGGECYFIDSARHLERVYDSIQQELRSQYLIAYQSTNVAGEEFREVEVEMHTKGLEAKTIRGYYP